MTLSPQAVGRLRRLLPRLASSFDGEVIATRNAIGRLLADADTDWHALADAICSGPEVVRMAATSDPAMPDVARRCRDLDGGRLTPKERAFVHDCCRRGFAWRPTPKQAAWLEAIHERLQPRAAA